MFIFMGMGSKPYFRHFFRRLGVGFSSVMGILRWFLLDPSSLCAKEGKWTAKLQANILIWG
jgi:hypothetical protein